MLRAILSFLIAFTIMCGVQGSLIALGMRPVFGMAGQFGTYSPAYIAKQKHKANRQFNCVWPKSKCTNGWVDRMTGCCPYRKNR